MEDAFSALVVIGVIFFRVILPVLRWFQKQQAEAAQQAGTAPGGSAPVSDPMRALREAIEALAGGAAATKEQLESAQRRLDGLIKQGELQLSRVPTDGATGVIAETLADPTLSELAAAQRKVESALSFLATADEAAAQGFLRNDNTLAQARDAGQLGEARLALLAEAASARHHRMAEVMADADAFASALVEPLHQFAASHGLPLPPNQPICLPTTPGNEAMIRGLFAQHPVIFVPRDYGEHIYRWPAVAHEVGHVMWHATPSLRREMARIAPSSERPLLPRAVEGRLYFNYDAAFAGWLEELVCDAFAIILMGPAGFRGLCHALDDRNNPMSAVFAAPDRTVQLLDEHPPPHLRVHLAAWLLDHIGFDQEMEPLLAEWQAGHEHADYLVLPIAGTRQTVSADLAGFLEKGTYILSEMMSEEFQGIGGYPLSAVVGQELGPGVWARVKGRADQILAGQPFHDSPVVAICAGIEAAAKSPASTDKIAAAVRAIIVGRDQRLSADPNFAIHQHLPKAAGPNHPVQAARDAILLWEVLQRPGGRTGPRRGPPPMPRRPPPQG